MKRLICAMTILACVLAGLSGCGTAGQVTVPAEDELPAESSAVSTEPLTKTETSQPGSSGITSTSPETPPTADSPQQEPQVNGSGDAVRDESSKETSPLTPPSNTANVSISPPAQSGDTKPEDSTPQLPVISQITTLESGLSSASFSGDDGFEAFLAQGGASSDADVTQFLASRLLADAAVNGSSFGCSTLTVSSPDGHQLFGRNFDWQTCNALVVTSKPSQGYSSISTVNLGFISQAGGSLNRMLEQNDIRVLAALYAPLDGMNEKGLAVSVNMIQDSASINQNTEKSDLTTTTAVRLLLNKAASVDEALDLLRQYDLHASMGMMIHFALADTTGKGVVVEYINNEMVVTETPVVTNFYLAEGTKHGIGTQQSHERYNILTQTLADHPTMTMEDVRDAMDSVSKDNFNEFESTEWSAVFDLNTGTAHYYHRENYENRYTFSIG